jgi:hypothetical protein
MIQVNNPNSIAAIADPILESLKNDGIMQDVISKAVSDRIIETAEKIGSSARQEMEDIDWTSEILYAVDEQGFSKELQSRLDDLGALGEVVSLRIQISLINYTNELATLKQEKEQLQEVEKETIKLTLEKRWEIKRNARLTRIHWLLTIFSLWPVLSLILGCLFTGFIGGALVCQHTHQNHMEIKQ